MMPDNWSFVIAAYLLAAVVLGAYWRHLVKKERELEVHDRMDRPVQNTQRMGGSVHQGLPGTEPRVPGTGHLRSEPSTRRPLP